MSWTCSITDTRAGNDGVGNAGASNVPGTTGVPGTSLYASATGALDYASTQRLVGGSDFAQPSTSHLRMLLHEAELNYVNLETSGRAKKAYEQLAWILVCAGNSGDPEIETVRTRARALMAQLSAGVDYFGYVRDYVPLVTVHAYAEFVDALFSLATDLEKAQEKYDDKLATLEARREALRQAIHTATESRDQLLASATRAAESVKSLRAEIAAMLAVVLEKEAALRAAQDKFTAAVERKAASAGGKCGFVDVITIVGSIISVASGVYTAAAGIVSEVKTIANTTYDSIENVKKGIAAVKAVAADVKSIAAGYQDIKKILSDASANDKDLGKLLAAKEELDKLIQPYLDLPEARDYRDLVRSYLDVVQARNAKILDVTALRLQVEAMNTDVATRAKELESMGLELADTADPASVAAASFMSRAVERAKVQLVRTLYMEHRAFEYWSLQRTAFVVADQSITHLKETHRDLLAGILTVMEKRGHDPQAFHSSPPIVFNKKSSPTTLRALINTHQTALVIPLSEPAFKRMAAVTVSSIHVELPGVRTSNQRVWYKLTHTGSGTFVDLNDHVWSFRHDNRAVFENYDYKTKEVFAPGDLNGKAAGIASPFAYLSPFSTWILEVPLEKNPGLDLSKVTEIRVEFHGLAFAH